MKVGSGTQVYAGFLTFWQSWLRFDSATIASRQQVAPMTWPRSLQWQ